MRTFAAALLLCLVLAPAAGAKRVALAKSKDLWATINVCDTTANPNTIGIRGSMPLLNHRTALWMRFQVQYLNPTDGKWHNIVANGNSKWRRLTFSKTDTAVESGQDFTMVPPPNGGSYTLRGAVSYKWVRRGHIVKKLRRFTVSGHRSLSGADPPGYSAAECTIS